MSWRTLKPPQSFVAVDVPSVDDYHLSAIRKPIPSHPFYEELMTDKKAAPKLAISEFIILTIAALLLAGTAVAMWWISMPEQAFSSVPL